MIRKYSNHPPEDNALPKNKRQIIGGFVAVISIFLVIGLIGTALFIFRGSLEQGYSRIAAAVQPGLAGHATLKESSQAFFQMLSDIWPGPKDPSAPLSLPKQQDGGNDFLYTVELTNGGKIEGRAIELGKAIVTVTDEKGVQIRVARGDVRRISKIRL